jgi:hypothetical protein
VYAMSRGVSLCVSYVKRCVFVCELCSEMCVCVYDMLSGACLCVCYVKSCMFACMLVKSCMFVCMIC